MLSLMYSTKNALDQILRICLDLYTFDCHSRLLNFQDNTSVCNILHIVFDKSLS